MTLLFRSLSLYLQACSRRKSKRRTISEFSYKRCIRDPTHFSLRALVSLAFERFRVHPRERSPLSSTLSLSSAHLFLFPAHSRARYARSLRMLIFTFRLHGLIEVTPYGNIAGATALNRRRPSSSSSPSLHRLQLEFPLERTRSANLPHVNPFVSFFHRSRFLSFFFSRHCR